MERETSISEIVKLVAHRVLIPEEDCFNRDPIHCVQSGPAIAACCQMDRDCSMDRNWNTKLGANASAYCFVI
jgi:hypothetical protein